MYNEIIIIAKWRYFVLYKLDNDWYNNKMRQVFAIN